MNGGYSEANLSASGNTYLVKWRDGKWKVVKDVMNWVSQCRGGGNGPRRPPFFNRQQPCRMSPAKTLEA